MLKGRQELEEELELAEEVEGQWTCRCAGLQAATWQEGELTLGSHCSLYLQ